MKILYLFKYLFILFFSIFFLEGGNSQNISLPVHSDIYLLQLTKNDNFLKTPIKPYLANKINLFQAYDSIYETDYYKKTIFAIKPIINNSYYTDFTDDNFFYTQNGFKFASSISKNLSFDFKYTFNYATLPQFAKKKVDSTLIFPQYNKSKVKNGNYYFHYYTGEIIYSPATFINFTLGNKHTFLGNGYRSLFLSDNPGNYFSFKALVDIWNINYFFQTSFFNDIHKVEPPYDLKKKFGTFHYISWDVTPKFNLNFFESVIWAPDDSTINRDYDINYLNPVVFLRPVEFSVGSPDNVLLGMGGNIEFYKNTLFYTQFILDEFNLSFIRETEKWWANKFGYQIGLKYWLKNSKNSAIICLEHNWMRPFTYTHAYTSKSYGNAIQPLTHPLGANFREWVSSVDYSRNKFFIQNIFYFQQYGTDSTLTNYGNNIYKSSFSRSLDYGSEILQGIKNTVLMNQLILSYLIYPKWFTFFDFELTYRNHNFNKTTKNNFYLSIGIRTGINKTEIFDNKY